MPRSWTRRGSTLNCCVSRAPCMVSSVSARTCRPRRKRSAGPAVRSPASLPDRVPVRPVCRAGVLASQQVRWPEVGDCPRERARTVSRDLLSTLTRQVLFAPLESSGRTEAILDRLRTAIALGVLAEGEQLPPEAELAAQFNVSPVTLRDALGTLRGEGIVETRRGRAGGTFVRVPDRLHIQHAMTRLSALSPVDLRDLADWRGAISATAAELAAERASDQNVATLVATARHVAEASEEVTARRADARFHIELAAAAQSARLSGAAISLQVDYAPLVTLVYQDPAARKKAAKLFRDIASSVGDGRTERARELTRQAVVLTRDSLLELRLGMTGVPGEEPSS